MALAELQTFDFAELTDEQREFYLQNILAEVVGLLNKDIESVAIVVVTEPKEDGIDESLVASGIHLCGIKKRNKKCLKATGLRSNVSLLRSHLQEAMRQYADTMEEDK